MQTKIKKDGTQSYEIIGRSGSIAGYLYRVGPQKSGSWLLQMLSSASEYYATFQAGKSQALTKAERY